MPRPTPDFDYVTIEWRGNRLDGAALTGKLRIKPNATGPMKDPQATMPVESFPVEFVVNINATQQMIPNAVGTPVQTNVGYASFELPVSNDPDIAGSGFTYTVTEEFDGGVTGRTYTLFVDKDAPGGLIRLQDITPTSPTPQQVISSVTIAAFDALEARVDVLEGTAAPTAATVSATPFGSIAGDTVQEQLQELYAETAPVGHTHSLSAAAISSNPFATIAASNVQAALEEIFAEAGGGGGSRTTTRARVYQTGGQTIAERLDGTTITTLATTPANNVTVIQAAINDIAGTYTPGTLSALGYGAGGTLELSEQLYEIDATIDVKYGVSVRGFASLDRNGFVASAHSYQGTVLAPTSGLSSMNIAASGAAVTRTPVLLLGRTQAANGVQSTTNPHGVTIAGIGIDMRRKTTAQGIVIADTQFVTVKACYLGEARGAGGHSLEIVSTNAPDDGAHGSMICGNLMVNCEKGVAANGSGSTDSILYGNRILQMTKRTIEIGASGGGGGWQIELNHLTTASTDQTGTDECHLYLSGAPCQVVGNYFDTTGGWDIWCDSPLGTITGNYFKHSSARPAAIYHTGNGRKTVITGNTGQLSSNAAARAFVQIASLAGQDYRPIITNNMLGDNGNAALVGIACDATGAVINEANSAMTIARDGTPNPYIWGNRIVASAV